MIHSQTGPTFHPWLSLRSIKYRKFWEASNTGSWKQGEMMVTRMDGNRWDFFFCCLGHKVWIQVVALCHEACSTNNGSGDRSDDGDKRGGDRSGDGDKEACWWLEIMSITCLTSFRSSMDWIRVFSSHLFNYSHHHHQRERKKKGEERKKRDQE